MQNTQVEANAVVDQYARELMQERHARIVAQCALTEAQAEVARLREQLTGAGTPARDTDAG